VTSKPYALRHRVSIHAALSVATKPPLALAQGLPSFQSTPSATLDVAWRLYNARDTVSIHTPAQARLKLRYNIFFLGSVSIHAPAGARPSQLAPLYPSVMLRFTNPARGGDWTAKHRSELFCVSIQRSPAVRDYHARRSFEGQACFNPGGRAERPPRCFPIASLTSFQSTRPRRTRHMVIDIMQATKQFQSTRPLGARLQRARIPGAREFQSTRPSEARYHQRATFQIGASFNPLTRPGARRIVIIDTTTFRSVSIHAPARGATGATQDRFHLRHVSIHAPVRGATAAKTTARVVKVFQSTRPRGARPCCSKPKCGRRFAFQSTRPRGARPDSESVDTPVLIVSIHAPARGATSGRQQNGRVSNVSIHAPARGATKQALFDEGL
jgi:hypothetical protein